MEATITRMHESFIANYTPALSDYEKEIVRYAMEAYRFLVEANTRISFDTWADRIDAYSENERSQEVTRIIRKVKN